MAKRLVFIGTKRGWVEGFFNRQGEGLVQLGGGASTAGGHGLVKLIVAGSPFY